MSLVKSNVNDATNFLPYWGTATCMYRKINYVHKGCQVILSCARPSQENVVLRHPFGATDIELKGHLNATDSCDTKVVICAYLFFET